jgi:hypothetical protein
MTGEFAYHESKTLVEAPTESPRLNGKRERPFHRRPLQLLALAGVILLFVLATIYHYAIYLPLPNLPHRLTVLDDVFALGVVGLVGLVGLALGRRLLCLFSLVGFSRPERGALALGLGWGVLSLAVLVLGMAHLFYAWLLIALLAVLLVIFWRDVWRMLLFLLSGAPLRWFQMVKPRGFFPWALALVLLVEAFLLGTQSLTLPYQPQGWDDYAYHWAVPQLYFLHHTIYGLPGWAHANFPMNSEMLNSLAFAFDSQIAAILLQQTFALLALLLLLAYLYRHWGLQALWIGAALCLSSLLLTTLWGSGYAELAVAYYGVASVLSILTWIEQQQHPEQPDKLKLLFLAGLFAGFGLGAKYTEGQIIAGAALLIAGVGIVKAVGRWRRGASGFPVLCRFLAGLVVYSAAVLLLLLPWLLKDWALLGNPIYPFVWGGPEWDAARTETSVVTFAHFELHVSLTQRLLGMLFALFFDNVRVADTPFFTPPNFFLLAGFLLPALVAAQRVCQRLQWLQVDVSETRRARQAMLLLVVIIVGYLAWVLSDAPVARYALPWIMLLAVPAAIVLAPASQTQWRWPLLKNMGRAVRAVFLFLLLFLVVVLGPLASLQFWNYYSQPFSLLGGAVSLHTWEEEHLFTPAYWKMVDYVEQHIPHSDRLLLVGQGTGYFLEGYDYVDDSGEDWIPYLETEGHTPAGILALLRQDGFRYLIYEVTTITYTVKMYENTYLAGFLPAFRQFMAGSLVQVWSYKNFAVYQVPSP